MPTVRHPDDFASWLDCLRSDTLAIIRAASAASKAADWLLGCLPEDVAVRETTRDDEEAA